MWECGRRVGGWTSAHGIENPIYVFPEMKLRGLVTNSYIHVSVSNLYICLLFWLQQNRQTNPENIYIAHRYMNVGIGRQNITILFENNDAVQFHF